MYGLGAFIAIKKALSKYEETRGVIMFYISFI